jgi:hypothetical protein
MRFQGYFSKPKGVHKQKSLGSAALNHNMFSMYTSFLVPWGNVLNSNATSTAWLCMALDISLLCCDTAWSCGHLIVVLRNLLPLE